MALCHQKRALLPATCPPIHLCPPSSPRFCFQQVPCVLSARSADLVSLGYTGSVQGSFCPWGLNCLNPPNPYTVSLWADQFFTANSCRILKTICGGGDYLLLHRGCPKPNAKLPLRTSLLGTDTGVLLCGTTTDWWCLVQTGTWPRRAHPEAGYV